MWSEENVKKEFMWEKIFPQITAVAERSYREADWETVFESSSWDAVESNEFKEDFSKFRYGLQNWLINLEEQGFQYNLPKTGVDEKNGKHQFKNLYTHNPSLFRWKENQDSDDWITWEELRSRQTESGVVEVVTTSYDGRRASYPVEFYYDRVACEAGCTDDLAECIIQCQTDNLCVSDCNRSYSDCLNTLC